MTVKEILKTNIDLAHDVTNRYLGDLNDADLLVRPVPGVNHIAWQLGHLIHSECEMMSGLGNAMPKLPDGFDASHSREAATSDDPSKFRKKAEYLSLFQQVHAATKKAIDATPEADLGKPGPASMRDYAPTVAHVLHLIGAHEMMHVGQFVAVRRKLGKPVVI
ncbi:MAG: DinB family protein [Phycisphaerae bacterium]